MICRCQGATINMQETPGASGRSGMSAKVTAKDHARQFPDVLYKSRCFAALPCYAGTQAKYFLQHTPG